MLLHDYKASRLKAKVYEAISRPALKYVSWAMKVNNKRKIATTEMGMLREIIGVLRRDHMRNDKNRRIFPVDEVMCCCHLRWFGQVQRRDENTVTCRVMDLVPDDEDVPRRHGTNKSRKT